MTYKISLNYMMEPETFTGTLQDAKKAADHDICYNQQRAEIYDDAGNLVSFRPWYGMECEGDCEDPICFGQFGYYDDWVDV